MRAKVPRLSGNCECHITDHLRFKNADECPRYSNTLLVSLNNRIYFRDQVPGSSGGADSSRLTISSRVRATGMGAIPFTTGRGETELRTPIEVFKLETTTTGDLERGKGDTASFNSDPR
jgi:hypothetical protein